jgi:hypothetical protein
MSGFGRHLTDFLKYVNYEMPAEEARPLAISFAEIFNYGQMFSKKP